MEKQSEPGKKQSEYDKSRLRLHAIYVLEQAIFSFIYSFQVFLHICLDVSTRGFI